MNNLRYQQQPPTTHADFEWHRGPPSLDAYNPYYKGHRKVISQIREGYWHFAICFWGDIGKIVEIGDTVSGNYYMIHDPTGNVRKVFEKADFKSWDMYCTGAPQVTSEMMIEIYEKYK